MALPNTLSNAVIKGNQISSSTINSVAYGYDNDCYIYGGNAVINENKFSGTHASGSTNRLYLASASCNITGNVFERNGFNINSFIYGSGSNDSSISNNIFDSTTVDGSDDSLVKNLTATSKFVNNINQIQYVPVPLINYLSGNSTSFTSISLPITGDAEISSLTGSSFTSVTVTTTNDNYIQFLFNLNDSLPKNVIIDEVKVGLSAVLFSGTGPSGSPNSMLLQIGSQETIKSNYAAGAGSILDSLVRKTTFAEYTSSSSYNILSNFSSLTSATQYISVSPVNQNYFINDGTYSLTARIQLGLKLAGASSVAFYLSPLVVKCRHL